MAASRDDDIKAVARLHGDSAEPSTAGRSSPAPTQPDVSGVKKKKKHRGGKNRKKTKRQATAPAEIAVEVVDDELPERPNPRHAHSTSMYRHHSNLSNTSLESEALLDHRERGNHRPRTQSIHHAANTYSRSSQTFARQRASNATAGNRPKSSRLGHSSGADLSDGEDDGGNEQMPLLHASRNRSKPHLSRNNSERNYGSGYRHRRSSTDSRTSSKRRVPMDITNAHSRSLVDDEDYDVNNPPSVPASPILGSLDDPVLPEFHSNSDRGRDVLIDIESTHRRKSSSSLDMMRRRPTVADLAERDVCFPGEHPLSEIGEEDLEERRSIQSSRRQRRRRRPWPDLEILEEWSREEKEERTHQEHIRAKKISEPVMVGGRLRPAKSVWHREEDDAPFRFTYFNDSLDGTIHARTISDLIQDNSSFRELFVPDPPELSDSSDDEDEMTIDEPLSTRPSINTLNQILKEAPPRNPISRVQTQSQASEHRPPSTTKDRTRSNTPSGQNSHSETPQPSRPKRYGPRPTWWLDVLQPTEVEMKVLAKAFQIHQLTIEDILMEEPREKVELFNNYYFVNYRSFEQDREDDDFMEPVNFYIIAFKDGVLTFHHSMTPHPANVRRRIRLLNGWTNPNPDWISYAIIDDVTDAFAPLTATIEDEVDNIDDEILYMHLLADDASRQNEMGKKVAKITMPTKKKKWRIFGLFRRSTKSTTQGDIPAAKAEGEKTAGESGGEMLRRVGECRKKVMGLYRLLGNKADVLKGFAKRCNEYWEVAPRHDIGMYLGDIQDHINTMTANVSHYESLLSRAHSNYVAQINIRMNERAESNADVLGKLTVLGTIVLPMNIITGMWGMNVWVPGQDHEGDLTWFFSITAGLILFGVSCFYGARKVYGIV